MNNTMSYHYLDHISITSLAPEVRRAMIEWLERPHGTSMSVSRLGIEARSAIKKAKASALELVGGGGDEASIVWTSSGAESTTTALWALTSKRRSGNRLALTGAATPEALRTSRRLVEEEGVELDMLPVDSRGVIDLRAVASRVSESTYMLAVEAANGDSGAIQPLEELSEIAHRVGAYFFVDATRGLGWTPIEARRWGIDYLAFAPYRFHGPSGVGGLYVAPGVPLRPLLVGADEEGGLRAGMENLPGIVGAGVACDLSIEGFDRRRARVRALRDRFHERVVSAELGATLMGPELSGPRLPHHLNFAFEGLEGEGVALLCDVRGLCIHSGTACAAKGLEPSHTLVALGFDKRIAQASVVISFSEYETTADIDAASDILIGAVERLRFMDM